MWSAGVLVHVCCADLSSSWSWVKTAHHFICCVHRLLSGTHNNCLRRKNTSMQARLWQLLVYLALSHNRIINTSSYHTLAPLAWVFSQMSVQVSHGEPLIKENCFIFYTNVCCLIHPVHCSFEQALQHIIFGQATLQILAQSQLGMCRAKWFL